MTIDDLKKLYQDYFDEVLEVQRSLRFGEGFLGIGRKVGDDPCQIRFAKKFEQALSEFILENPDPVTVKEVLEYIYTLPIKFNESDSRYWMLIGVHQFTLGCIDLLTADDAAAMEKEYNSLYPRRLRLPTQNNVAKALKKRAG